jgi:hypothetical protein
LNFTPTFLDDFNADAILGEAQATNSRQVKRSLIERGLVYQISFWGAVTKISTDVSEARRYEFFSSTPYTERETYLIKHVIAEIKPPYNYSIWEYSSKRKAMKEIAHYGPRIY